MSSCSIVIVSYKTGSTLFAAIKFALHQQKLAEIILVDNGNPPDILARLQQIAIGDPRLKIITGQGNVGFTKASNLGAKHASGEYLLFLKPTCLLSRDALLNCINAFEERPEAQLAGCFLQDSDSKEISSNSSHLITPTRWLAEISGLGRIHQYLDEEKSPIPLDTYEIESIPDSFMFMRKLDYDQLQGFDENFVLYGENIDLCVRIRNAGGKVISIPRVKVTRLQNTTPKSTPQQIEWLKTKDTMYYFKKHFTGKIISGVLLLLNAVIISRYAIIVALTDIIRFVRRKPNKSFGLQAKKLQLLAKGYIELPESRELEGKAVIITGATSELGLSVMRRLLAANASVLAISRKDAIPFPHERLRWIKADLTDKTYYLHGNYADIAIHCAPLWHMPAAIEILHGSGVKRIIAFGSTNVFAKTTSDNWFEKEAVAMLANAESVIESSCREKNIDWTLLRSTQVYGLGFDTHQEISAITSLIKSWGCFMVYPPAQGKRQPVHVDDLATTAINTINNTVSFGKSYNLSGSETLGYRDMVIRIFTLLGKKPKVIESTLLPFILDVAGWVLQKKEVNREIAYRMNEDFNFFYDAATTDLNFSPRPFLSGRLRDDEEQ